MRREIDVIRSKNLEARNKLEQDLREFFSTEKCVFRDEALIYVANGKLNVAGSRVDRGNYYHPPTIKFYFNISLSNAPQAFDELYKEIKKQGVLPYLDLALNLDALDTSNDFYGNNALLINIDSYHPFVKEQVAKAIIRTKKNSKDLWDIPPKYKAQAKEGIIRDLMIPLDDTVAMVELPNPTSYHFHLTHGKYKRGEKLKGGIAIEMDTLPSEYMYSWQNQSSYRVDFRILDEMTQNLKVWTPETPGTFENFPERKKYMPPLVFDNT